MMFEACETILDLAERMKLPRRIVQQLMDEATQHRFVEAKVRPAAWRSRSGMR